MNWVAVQVLALISQWMLNFRHGAFTPKRGMGVKLHTVVQIQIPADGLLL